MKDPHSFNLSACELQILTLLESFLSGETVLSDKILHYACSTLGCVNSNDIYDLLKINDGYSNGLAELIIVPDNNFLRQLEELIPSGGISFDSENIIIHHLSSKTIQKKIIIDDNTAINLNINPDIIIPLIRKFHLTKNCSEIMLNPDEPFLTDIKVILRKSSVDLIGQSGSVINKILSDSRRRSLFNDIRLLIEYVLLFINGLSEEEFLNLLELKKIRIDEILCAKSEINSILKLYPVEVMMAQKLPIPAADEESLIKEISIIEDIIHILNRY